MRKIQRRTGSPEPLKAQKQVSLQEIKSSGGKKIASHTQERARKQLQIIQKNTPELEQRKRAASTQGKLKEIKHTETSLQKKVQETKKTLQNPDDSASKGFFMRKAVL